MKNLERLAGQPFQIFCLPDLFSCFVPIVYVFPCIVESTDLSTHKQHDPTKVCCNETAVGANPVSLGRWCPPSQLSQQDWRHLPSSVVVVDFAGALSLFLLLPSLLSSLLFGIIVASITAIILVSPAVVDLASFAVLAAFVVALADCWEPFVVYPHPSPCRRRSKTPHLPHHGLASAASSSLYLLDFPPFADALLMRPRSSLPRCILIVAGLIVAMRYFPEVQ